MRYGAPVMGSLTITRLEVEARELAARSCAWRPNERVEASLLIGSPTDDAFVLGSFQRLSEIGARGESPVVRRGSGGGVACVGQGSIWVQLALTRPDALVAGCTADKLLNRYVRPLLRAITKVASTPASYFGRDWISAAHRPVALVAFAHEARTNASFFEAIVAVSTPFATEDRPTFVGKVPATLEDLTGRSLDRARIVDAIADAYRGIATSVVESDPTPVSPQDLANAIVADEPAWTATREEAIGLVAAGHDASGTLRIGGELMASNDAIARLEELVSSLPENASETDVGRAVDDALTTGNAITFGVRSLTSIRDVLLEARR